MKFCSAYFWEKGKEQVHNPVSLVLQQVEVCKQSVLLACVCRGRAGKDCDVAEADNGCEVGDCCDEVEISGYFTEALVEWFHRECIELVEQKRPDAEVERSLQKEIRVIFGEVLRYSKTKGRKMTMDCVGMLMVEHNFWIFSKGNGRIFLLNRRYNQKHMRCVMGSGLLKNAEDAFSWEKGILQKKLGLLLCTNVFDETLDRKAVAEALLVEGRIEEERIQKRLKEVWSMKRENTEKEMIASASDEGAVYIMTY